jgi:high-affinity iron transporter
MLSQYLITFREVFEVALITSIIFAYLIRTGRKNLTLYVWYGVLLAIGLSIILGIIIWFGYGKIPKKAQSLFEGISAFIAVFVLSWMIFWMAKKGKELKYEVERRVETIATRGTILGLLSFSFIVVFREGLETVLFLTPFLVTDTISTFWGLFFGAFTSLIFSYLIFVIGMKINIRKFFYFTSILLVFIAGGLAGYGVHEIIEYTGSDLWGWFAEYAYDLKIPKDHPLHHKGIIGSIFAVMFGYSVEAEWARVFAHFLYFSIVLPLIFWIYKKEAKVTQ